MMTAIIPARAGSKGVPGKNLRAVGGVSLVERAVRAAEECPYVAKIILSSDGEAILHAVTAPKLVSHLRSSDLSSDTADVRMLVKHLAKGISTEFIVLLQPTSPFRSADHITESFEAMKKAGRVSCISICPAEHPANYYGFHMPDGSFRSTVPEEQMNLHRQDAPKLYRLNGAIYIVRTEDFIQRNDFRIEPVHRYVMSESDSIDIDTELDLIIANYRTDHLADL